MNIDTERLLALQEVDKEIIQLRKEMGRYEHSRQAHRTQLARGEARIEEIKAHVLDLEKCIREADLQVSEWRENLGRFTAQQSRVKTQKEYDTLTHELTETEEKISQSDEQALGFLEEEEALDAKLVEMEKDIESKRSHYTEEIQRIDEREAEKQSLIDRLEARRQDIASQVAPKLLDRYGKLSERYPGTAVVALLEGNCGGCFLRVVHRNIQSSDVGEGLLVDCTSCHRLLYTPPTLIEE